MPPAVLAWLDYSESDQRKAREIVALFSQRESRDELGLGLIRDTLSDTLFPGTSVLLTRARYFLFVPWLYREGGRRGYRDSRLASWVEGQERRLINVLREGGDHNGLIGRNVGAAVQNLPSTLYWNSLRRFGILRKEGTAGQVVGLSQITRQLDDATEFLERSDAVWVPSIPAPPADFFSSTECNFVLTHDEATWLAERIIDAAPDTLLQHLVVKGHRPVKGARYVWEDPGVEGAPSGIHNALQEARRFAVVMHGAALLYNVLLAERAEQLGLTEHETRRDRFAARLDQWRAEIESSDILTWDLDRLWALLAEQERPAAQRTRLFVTAWNSLVRGRLGKGLVDDRDARNLVEERELHQKKGQARLRNDRLMRQWGGASGSDRLNFRWPVVAGLLNDIADGREDDSARS